MSTTIVEGTAPASSLYDVQIKLLLIGDSAVGKSSLLTRYVRDDFDPTFITTIGIDFQIKTVVIDDCRLKLRIWDTAGQERFRTITRTYYRGAQGILLVYDITDRRSFEAVRHWMSEIQNHASIHVDKMLIGNKCDMEEDRVVSVKEGSKLAKEFGAQFLECSASSNINVDQAFEQISTTVKDRIITNKTRCFQSAEDGPIIVDRFDVPHMRQQHQQGKRCC